MLDAYEEDKGKGKHGKGMFGKMKGKFGKKGKDGKDGKWGKDGGKWGDRWGVGRRSRGEQSGKTVSVSAPAMRT